MAQIVQQIYLYEKRIRSLEEIAPSPLLTEDDLYCVKVKNHEDEIVELMFTSAEYEKMKRRREKFLEDQNKKDHKRDHKDEHKKEREEDHKKDRKKKR